MARVDFMTAEEVALIFREATGALENVSISVLSLITGRFLMSCGELAERLGHHAVVGKHWRDVVPEKRQEEYERMVRAALWRRPYMTHWLALRGGTSLIVRVYGRDDPRTAKPPRADAMATLAVFVSLDVNAAKQTIATRPSEESVGEWIDQHAPPADLRLTPEDAALPPTLRPARRLSSPTGMPAVPQPGKLPRG